MFLFGYLDLSNRKQPKLFSFCFDVTPFKWRLSFIIYWKGNLNLIFLKRIISCVDVCCVCDYTNFINILCQYRGLYVHILEFLMYLSWKQKIKNNERNDFITKKGKEKQKFTCNHNWIKTKNINVKLSLI